MPVKNAGLFLVECLDSVINQSYSNWQLIAVDDHSTDETRAILENFAKKDNRINFLANYGSGIIDALNTAYQNSIGDYITRMDADDIMPSNKLEELMLLFKRDRRGIVATGLVKYIENDYLQDGYRKYSKWLNSLTQKEENYLQIYKECVIPSSCWMVHRNDLEKAGAFRSHTYPEDYDLCFRFYEADLKVVGSKKVLHYWRDHPERASRNDPNYSNQLFFHLKWTYFKKLDLNPSKELIIWGAGKKAKEFVKIIVKDSLKFRWVCDNTKKHGKKIYKIRIEDFRDVTNLKSKQFIILVSSKKDQIQISSYLNSFGLVLGKDYYLFC